MRNSVLRVLALPLALGVGATVTSCGGGGSGGGSSAMVLVGFNLPNIAGVALDTPLVYTFSQDVDPASVTPDTIQVTGPQDFGFTFETIVVDGNLVAELPRIPRFEDYSDGGMFAGKTYNVFLPVFPAVDTVRSADGHALVRAESFSFTTTPTVTFVEPRRPLIHAPGPISGPNLRGDEDGCLQNANNELYVFPGFQFGTDADARLLCVKNEGAPHVLNSISTPKHDTRAVGTPSAVQPGTLDLPAIRVRFNEPVDPLTVVPYVPTTQLSLNVTLWRVGDTDANPLAAPEQIVTTKPVVVQDLALQEAILTAVGPQKQGTYLINVAGVKDLPGNTVDFSDSPSPAIGGYQAIPPTLVGKVPPGYRMFFRTLELGTLPGSITENYGDNFDERTTGLFTSSTATNPALAIPTSPAAGGTGFTLSQAQPGQATNANWNGTRRFMGRSTLVPNNAKDDGSGTLKAVFEPFLGNGGDGALNVTGSVTLSSDVDDGVFEYTSVTVNTGATLRLTGSRPVIILCQGAFTVNGTVDASGAAGGFGIDTDGGTSYTNGSALFVSGAGGAAGAGGGAGGHGAPVSSGSAAAVAGGGAADTWSSPLVTTGLGGAGANGNGTNQGGGGAGFGTAASGGSGATNGATYGSVDFARSLATFIPDRNYEPNTGILGGSGGGGGGADDDNGASEAGDGSFPFTGGQESGGDDGGGGGGGAGGALWVIADTIAVGSTGTINANGGRGGNTYGPAEQIVTTIPDAMSGTISIVSGVTNPNAPGTGAGGGGGGGSGGAILLQARTSLTTSVGSVVTAVGGAGGTALAKNGGTGGVGRIALMSFATSGDAVAGTFSVLGTVTPAAGASGAIYKPTTDLTSQGVTLWFDQVTTTATYSVAPVEDDNFATLTGAGLTRGLLGDFEAILEFQGADTLTPALDVQNATGGTGITAWSPTISSINGKRFFRFRWRFFVAHADANAGNNPDFDQNVNPMPEILSVTIPFQK